jgi:hypothetical protein
VKLDQSKDKATAKVSTPVTPAVTPEYVDNGRGRASPAGLVRPRFG